MINILSNSPMPLYLGRQGETGVRKISFYLTPLREEYGEGVLSLLVKRTPSEEPYPVAVEISGDEGIWTISNVDTDIPGEGEAQLTYTVDGKVKKSVIYKTKVNPSLVPSSETPPDAYNNWLDELAVIGGRVASDAAEGLSALSEGKADALNAIDIKRQMVLSDVDDAGSDILNSIENSGNSYLEQISDNGSDALSDIRLARTGALQAIDTDESDALTAISNARSSALEVMAQKVTQAENAASAASDSAQAAADAADEARSYAENLHFTDSGDGSISITIGG